MYRVSKEVVDTQDVESCLTTLDSHLYRDARGVLCTLGRVVVLKELTIQIERAVYIGEVK